MEQFIIFTVYLLGIGANLLIYRSICKRSERFKNSDEESAFFLGCSLTSWIFTFALIFFAVLGIIFSACMGDDFDEKEK